MARSKNLKYLLSLVLLAFGLNLAALPASIEVVTEQYPPYNFEKDGEVQGSATAVVKAVFAELDIDPRFRVMRWSRAFRRAQRQPDVLIYSIGRTPEREHDFYWIGVVAPFDIWFYKAAHRVDVPVDPDPGALRIGVVSGDVRDQYLSGYEQYQLRRFPDSVTALKALYDGQIDLFPASVGNFAFLAEYAGFKEADFIKTAELSELNKEGLYMAFGLRTSRHLVEAFRTACQSLIKP